MRIVYVLTSLGVGGAERQALAVANRMAFRGHEVAVLVLSPRIAEEWPTTLPTVHLNMRKTPASALAGLAQAGRFLRKFHPDLLHSHSFHANIAARLLNFLVLSTKVLSTVHNVYEGGRLRMLSYRLTDIFSRKTTAVSQAAADRFIRLKAVPRQKCLVIPNGIDIAEFTPNADRRAARRAAMGTDASFIWLAAGRLVPAKDYPNLLRAFKQVRAVFPNAQLWIAGGVAGAKLKRTGNGISHYVSGFVFEQGSMEQVRVLGLRRDMSALFDAADAFVLSSVWEGMPLAVGEAMAMEKPVVATDVGGTRELIGDAGIIVPPKDTDSLAKAMLDLMQQPAEIRLALGQAARARIKGQFSMVARADEWEALYRVIVEAQS
ncbi:MAG TPA: glycosyltransferase [Terracidiphilus sp.]|nr:glycosyltransferase [Terracidiphilus sp.]